MPIDPHLNCTTCMFFQPSRLAPKEGECRLNAPTPNPDGLAIFPHVIDIKATWCGAHTPNHNVKPIADLPPLPIERF